jgi:hypothetical protein
MFAEVYATDSYQNILLSLIQFPIFRQSFCARQAFQKLYSEPAVPEQSFWPSYLTIISHDFKRSRFLDLHLPSIQPPVQKVEFIGIDPPFDSAKLAEIVEGDRLRGFGVWKDDLHGNGQLLSGKRVKRGWDEVSFTNQVLSREELWSTDDRQLLAALVRGETGARWPSRGSPNVGETAP